MVRSAQFLTFGLTSTVSRGLVALLIALSVSGCTQSTSPSTSSTTLTIGAAPPPVRDSTAGVPALIDLLTLEAPIAVGWDGKPVRRVVDKWEWSPDGLTLRLWLRSGVVFHDGTKLNNALAADILKETLKPEGLAVSKTIVSIVPEGSDEIVIRTGQPEGFLLSDMSLANFSLPGQPHVGTGPFRLESEKAPILLRAFDGYRSGRPAIETVKISEYESQRQAWAAMMRGEAEVLHDVSVESLDFVEAESTVQTFSFVKSYYHALIFNLELRLFAQKDLRKALNAAVDRTQVVDLSLRKRGIPSDGPIWPYHFGRSSEQPAYNYDPGQAEALLDGLGLTEGRELQPGRMPSRFRFTCLIAREDQRMQRIALVVQKQLFNIGVDMDVEVMPFRAVQGRIGTGQFEAALVEFGAFRSLNNVYAMWHSVPEDTKGLNLHYKSADAALEKLRAAIKEEDVKTAVAELQRAFYDDPPAVFLDWMQTARAVSRSVLVQNEPGRDVMGTIQQWRPVAAKTAPPQSAQK
jgi:peptide/nickel transport system substrate-binding protein